MRSVFAREIFSQELMFTYQQQTEYRDRLREQGRERVSEIVAKINAGEYLNPRIEELLVQLSDRLPRTTGKKVHGYLKSDGCPQNTTQVILEDYLLSWLVNVKRISRKPSSYDRLEATALKQVIPRIGSFKITEITPEDIGAMLTEIKDEGLSYSTVKKAFDCVNAVLTYAFNKRDIPCFGG